MDRDGEKPVLTLLMGGNHWPRDSGPEGKAHCVSNKQTWLGRGEGQLTSLLKLLEELNRRTGKMHPTGYEIDSLHRSLASFRCKTCLQWGWVPETS